MKYVFAFLMLLPFVLIGGCVEQQRNGGVNPRATGEPVADAGADTEGDVEEVADEVAEEEEADVEGGVAEEKEAGGGQEEGRRFPESLTRTMMEQCMGEMHDVQECECGVKNYQKTHRPEDYNPYDSDLMIAAAQCRRNQHIYPDWAVKTYMDNCMKNGGMDRDECECEVTQDQQLMPWVDIVRVWEHRINVPNEVTVAKARCVKNQHRYPKWWAKLVTDICLAAGNTLAGCKCELEKDQELERLEDHMRRSLYDEPIPLNVRVAEAQCWKDQHHYPPGIVKRWMEGCTRHGHPEDFCTCWVETIQKELSYVDFRRAGPLFRKASSHAYVQCTISTTPSNQGTF